jgi:predicted transcriptional regulator
VPRTLFEKDVSKEYFQGVASAGSPRLSAEPDRFVTDPKALRALAHPVRLALLEVLYTERSATATRCSELLGPSPSACSFHLRTLARYGLIEAAPGGKGPERPWRLTHEELGFSDTAQTDPEGVEAARLAGRVFIEREMARLLAWPNDRDQYPKAWRRNASVMLGSIAYLTRAELDEFQTELRKLIERYDDRLQDPATRPRGSRPVRVLGITVPITHHQQRP